MLCCCYLLRWTFDANGWKRLPGRCMCVHKYISMCSFEQNEALRVSYAQFACETVPLCTPSLASFNRWWFPDPIQSNRRTAFGEWKPTIVSVAIITIAKKDMFITCCGIKTSAYRLVIDDIPRSRVPNQIWQAHKQRYSIQCCGRVFGWMAEIFAIHRKSKLSILINGIFYVHILLSRFFPMRLNIAGEGKKALNERCKRDRIYKILLRIYYALKCNVNLKHILSKCYQMDGGCFAGRRTVTATCSM